MNELVREFEHFTRARYRSNPNPGESETTAFIRHLAQEKALLEFGPADWLALVDHLGLPEDQVGELMEGAAAWIPEEPVPPSDQEPADWPTEVPKTPAVASQANPAIKYGKGTEIEDCVCEETCDCEPCPCDECEECEFCLCCCVCSEDEDESEEEEPTDAEDQDPGEEE